MSDMIPGSLHDRDVPVPEDALDVEDLDRMWGDDATAQLDATPQYIEA